MRRLNVGINFSQEHVDTVIKNNELYSNEFVKIEYVYGSPGKGNRFGSVRPSERETESKLLDFRNRVVDLKDCGIKTNLTFNSLYPHLKGNLSDENIFDSKNAREELDYLLKSIEGYVENLIVAHPFIIDYIHDNDLNFGIVTSTIMNIHSLPQMMWIAENWPKVVRVCPALWKNRDGIWLKTANRIIPLELLANEFCSIGGVECEGIYRQACYLSQSMDVKNWNPMCERCIGSRRGNMEAWLKARFILPQWMSRYESAFDIEHFKITGRTHSTKFVDFISSTYLKEDFDGNLLELWGHLQATLNKDDWTSEQLNAIADVNIPVKAIDHLWSKFIHCHENSCFSCSYCKAVAQAIERGNYELPKSS